MQYLLSPAYRRSRCSLLLMEHTELRLRVSTHEAAALPPLPRMQVLPPTPTCGRQGCRPARQASPCYHQPSQQAHCMTITLPCR